LSAGLTLAIAESLTGGLVTAELTSVPGASKVIRGGVIAYHSDLKSELLLVSAQDITRGVVSEEVVIQMARGVRQLCGADIGLACSGVAGPGDHDGVAQGTVWIAGTSESYQGAKLLHIEGDRDHVRKMTADMLIRFGCNMLCVE
jgi:nicotinamide-nucleotide amidase